ncbi:unnamed protein product [Rhizophagus irregularis]|nr:unnamed protein product [Rhizophagus irregularis]
MLLRVIKNLLVNTRVKKKVQDLQASQHITIADERTVKRAKIHEDSNGDENNPFYVSGEKSSTDSPNDIADNTLLVSGEKSSNDDSEDDEIVTSPSPQPQNGNKDSLSHTPNKREMSDERIVQYLIAMKQTLKYDQVTVQKPSVWTESLNTYSLKK